MRVYASISKILMLLWMLIIRTEWEMLWCTILEQAKRWTQWTKTFTKWWCAGIFAAILCVCRIAFVSFKFACVCWGIFKFSTVKLCFCYAFQFSARHNRAEMRSCSLFSIKCFLCYMCSHWFCKHFAVEFPSNSFSWNLADETVDYLVKCGQKLVNPMNAVWRPVCQKTYCNWHDDLLTILYQVLPSMLMDLFIKSPKHKLMPFVRKIMAMAEVIKFFNHNNFIFANSNYFSVIDG